MRIVALSGTAFAPEVLGKLEASMTALVAAAEAASQ